MKKKLLKTTFTEKLEVTKCFNISKISKAYIYPKKKSLQSIGYPDARKTLGKS